MVTSTLQSTQALDIVTRVMPDPDIEDQFTGAGRDYGPLRIYGGHLLGQGLAAALATVTEDKLAHSLHAYFLAVGEPDAPITYQVQRLRDGKNYVTRMVQARQGDKRLLTLMVSCKKLEPGDEHQPMAPAVPDAHKLVEQRRDRGDEPLALPFAAPFGIELESVDGWRPRGDAGQAPAIQLWMRAPMSSTTDARVRQCALAYLSDGSLMFNAVRPYGNAFSSHRATSLDHSVWFHRDSDPAQWLLFDQDSPAAADSRGLNMGRIFDGQGNLVASVAQESMLRRV